MSGVLLAVGIVFLLAGGSMALALFSAGIASAIARECVLDKMNTEIRVMAIASPILSILGLVALLWSGA